MIVPVNTNINKAGEIGEQHRQHRFYILPRGTMRRFYLEHHYSNDNGQYAIAEGF